MLGHRVVNVARDAGHEVVGIDIAEADITDAGSIGGVIAEAAPDAIVNCAAYTNVDGAEQDEERATAINATGAGNVARAAASVGARVVHLSTDYVFDGEKESPWVESDPVGPLGVYGRSKLAGEEEVATATADHAIARTAWLFGSGGPNFCDTMLRLASERETVSVVTDQIGCPTWTGHLAPALIELAAHGEAGIFHIAGGGQCSWFELTQELFRVAEVDCRVEPTTSAQFVRPAPRPSWSVMASERDWCPVLPPWQEGVAGHLSERIDR